MNVEFIFWKRKREVYSRKGRGSFRSPDTDAPTNVRRLVLRSERATFERGVKDGVMEVVWQ